MSSAENARRRRGTAHPPPCAPRAGDGRLSCSGSVERKLASQMMFEQVVYRVRFGSISASWLVLRVSPKGQPTPSASGRMLEGNEIEQLKTLGQLELR